MPNGWSRTLEDAVAWRRYIGPRKALIGGDDPAALWRFYREELGTSTADPAAGHLRDRRQYYDDLFTANALDQGGVYWVAPDIVDLIGTAAESLPGAWGPMSHVAPPEPSGFVEFSRPIPMVGEHTVVKLTEDGSPGDPTVEERPFRLSHLLWQTVGGSVWLKALDKDGGSHPIFIDGNLEPMAPAREPQGIDWIARALWLLSQQRLASIAYARPDRPARRRLQRMGVDLLQVPELRVVTLRRLRKVERSDEVEETQWTHRWVVDGHWFPQWYPSLQEHRLIWKSPFVKGPEHLPLVVKRRVYRFTR